MDREEQRARATAFRAMHASGPVLRLVNAWDASSARVMAAAGAAAVGTTSFGVALDHGVGDGEQLPLTVALAVAAEIVESVDVPVTVDIEAGRGQTPDEVGRTVAAVTDAGAVGVNLEDSVPGQPGALFATDNQSERLAAARAAADDAGVPIFINARCDVFFGANVDPDRRVDETLARADRYRAAGADGLFLPGLLDLATIQTITGATDLPLNVMMAPGMPTLDQLADAGVRRISQGGVPFLAVAGTLKSLTERYLAGDLAVPADELGAGAPLLSELLR